VWEQFGELSEDLAPFFAQPLLGQGNHAQQHLADIQWPLLKQHILISTLAFRALLHISPVLR
jgi:hypothetical protein